MDCAEKGAGGVSFGRYGSKRVLKEIERLNA